MHHDDEHHNDEHHGDEHHDDEHRDDEHHDDEHHDDEQTIKPSHGLGAQRESRQTIFCLRRFWVKKPRH